MRQTRDKGSRVYLSMEPEDHGYEWDDDEGAYMNDGYEWEDQRDFEIEADYGFLYDNLPRTANWVVLENRYGHDEMLETLREAVETAMKIDGGLERVEYDGEDLYVNGHLVRELTSKGMEWARRNDALYDWDGAGATHCLETASYTKAIRPQQPPKRTRSPSARRKGARRAKAGRPATKRRAAATRRARRWI